MPPTATVSSAQAAERWSRRANAATQDYTDGVQRTTRSWAAAAGAAGGNYRAGVTAAAGAGRYEAGVQRAGDARWKRRASELGGMRYGPGVQSAQADYATAIGPVLETIARTDLPPRGPVGSDGNYNRSRAIGVALRSLRTGTKR